MARAIWSGAISFGLIFIPVSLLSAEEPDELDLTMLDSRDFSPVGFKRYNKRTGKEVAWDRIIKGYEYEPDQFVALSDADFRAANVKATQTIDLLSFVAADDVEPMYFEKPYYLTPAKRGEKVYALLREALRRSGKVAVAQIVIRVKQHLALISPVGDALVLNTVRYGEEIRGTDALKLPGSIEDAGIAEKEVKMAMALIDGMSEDWQPQRYQDRYRHDLLALIDEKSRKHQTHDLTPDDAQEDEAPASAEVIDLMDLLKKSLSAAPTSAASGRAPAAKESTAKAKAAKPAVSKAGKTTPAGKARSASPAPAASRRKQA
ncbi:Non-homologous end joining protein Ku [Andreprevotia sp. IGB-42]|uniref:non-homologous end joining protein Ku n=1 Tax=Andreprevotia sp. IGB-42 TaxID=2497473 RepID=UPI00135C6E6F|nr:Ku protein [Andreprevotia sp. IGB-42]KAF0813642.1 Non-homologous end joining protein Ku [Andreprevotia sp. IGB-42]